MLKDQKKNVRSIATNSIYLRRLGISMLNLGLTVKVVGTDSHTTDRNRDYTATQYNNCYIRCSAGSDNPNAGRNCQRRRNSEPAIWGGERDGQLPPLRTVFRDQVTAQPAQPAQSAQPAQPARPARPMRSRIPVPCPWRPEQPRRQDRPVNLYDGSRLPVPNRPGPAPPRIRNPRRVASVAQVPDIRRGTYDVQPPPCGDQNDRRGTYDVQPPPCGDQNDRRGTYDVSQPCTAVQNQRRGTYNVSQPCAAVQNDRRDVCDGQPRPAATVNCVGSGTVETGNMTGSFTMTGTIQLDRGFQGLSAARQPPRNRSSSCNRLHDTDGDIDDYLDNHLNYDMVAPREIALPGQPYVAIDESDGNTTPDQWRLTMDNRSSVGSQAMGIPSPAYDTSADSSGMSRWSPADRQSRPFGLNDSFTMGGTSTPRERPSRARSAAHECGLPFRNSRRRDTFDRNTR